MNGKSIVCDLNSAPELAGPLHLAVGMFDGVHLGHQAVIDAAKHSARRTWGHVGALTFSPHPSRLFRPDDPTLLMMPVEMKTSFLHYLGIDVIINQEFTPSLAKIEADAFLPFLKNKLPPLSALYIGENFRFGKERKGDVNQLVESGRPLNINIFSIERIKQNGEHISSTRIRSELVMGNIAKVNALLGYTYRSEGVIIPGKKLGHQIGFPTLNLVWEPELKPRFGVYAVKVKQPDGDPWLPAVANYGVRPTVDKDPSPKPLLEVHLFSDTQLGPQDPLYVEWYAFIRGEKKFPSLEALKQQISHDLIAAKNYFLG